MEFEKKPQQPCDEAIEVEHATREAYNKGCRGTACREANTEYQKAYRERKKEEQWGSKYRGLSLVKDVKTDEDGHIVYEDLDFDEFFVMASDKQGHSQQVRVNAPGYLLSEIAEFVQNPALPYRTPADAVRNYIYHGIKMERMRLRQGMTPELEAFKTMSAIETEHAKIVEHERLLEKAEARVASLLDNRDSDDLKLWLERIPKMMATAPTTDIRRRYSQMFVNIQGYFKEEGRA